VEECGHNIPGFKLVDDEVTFARLRFAALKASRGDIEVLKEAIALERWIFATYFDVPTLHGIP
jgi:hypothetical protein